jgi:hypothetical protein
MIIALQKGRERLIIYIDDTRPTGISEKVVVLISKANQGAEFTLIDQIFTLYYSKGKRVKEYKYYDGFSTKSNDLILNDDKLYVEFRSVGKEMDSNRLVDTIYNEDSSAFNT